MRAIEAGMPLTEMTKNRLSELDVQRTALSSALAQTQLDGGFKLQKEHIQFFITQFREMDYADPKCQQRLIDVFINSIYVTDEEITINFNFGGDSTTLKFSDFEKIQESRGAGVFGCRALASATTRKSLFAEIGPRAPAAEGMSPIKHPWRASPANAVSPSWSDLLDSTPCSRRRFFRQDWGLYLQNSSFPWV